MSKKLFNLFRQSEQDCTRAAVFGQIVDEYLDSIYYEGYAEQLRSEDPDEYQRQYLFFIEQTGGNSGGGILTN